jgi:PAS domain S-box-containing protein
MQRRRGSDPAIQSFWTTAVAAAVAARRWAETAQLPNPDNEMVAALLCDIGSLILMEGCPEKYETILRQSPESLVHRQCELEEEVFGFNHAELGAEVLRRWGLPEDITEAIRYHHFPERAADKSPAIADRAVRLYLASCLAQMQRAPGDTQLFTETLRLARDRFQLGEQQMVAWLEPLNQQIDELARLMQVETGPCHHYPSLLADHMESLAQLASEMALENIRVEERVSQAELELQIGEEELQRLGREHALILNTAGEGIYGVDAQGRLTFVNPAAARMVGWSAAELIGRPQHEVLQPRRADGSPARWEQSVVRAVLRDGVTRRVESDVYWRRDGSCFPVMYVCAPILEGGAVLGAVVTCRDVTEQKRAEEALRRSEEQLRQVQKMEAVGSLAGGVAHDFNNLLTIINGYSDLLLETFDLPEAAREVLREIRKAGERSERVTRQLLTICRRQVLDPKVMDINAAVRDVQKMLQRLIGEDIRLGSVLAEDPGWIKADLGQIQQVLLNLAVNARDAMPRGGSLTIATANTNLDEDFVRTRPGLRAGPHVLLTVTDTGCGMDEATRLRIFEPFFTTKGAGKGTGLGLSTVHGIVEQSGGAIEVISQLGQGASFQIYLPRVEDPAPVAPSRALDQGASRLRREATILLVEDDEAVRSLLCAVLAGSHHRVLAARDGREALRLADAPGAAIDLLITDVVMPEMSGTELASQLSGRFTELEVLYVSGYLDDAVLRHGVLSQEAAFLQKPFSQKDLLAKIDAILSCSAAAAEPAWETAAPAGV